jgi:predicted amidohydrolase YtcJ
MPAPEPRVWLNGPITGAPFADALYAEDGRIVSVGGVTEVLRAVPTGAERVELHGRRVIPGLIDAHLHIGASVRTDGSADLSTARSLPGLLELLRGHLGAHPGPLLGEGWDQELLAERRMPTRADLDRLPTRDPVILYRRCGHVAVLNSIALAVAGVDDATKDPPNGRFGRSGGSLDGRLFEGAMDRLAGLEERWWPLDPTAVRTWLSTAASMGLTGLGAMSAEPEELQAVREALSGGPPTVRVRAYLRAYHMENFSRLRRDLDGPALRIQGLKVMADGSLGARTAWLARPYDDAPGESGTPRTGRAELERILRTAVSERAATAIHAIGDGAFDAALGAIEAVPEHGPVRIEHASVAPLPLIDRAVRCHVPLVVQPSFVPSDTWIPERLGPERARWAYPFRTMLARGVLLAGSSDSPVESGDPWAGMAAATRARAGAAERLDPSAALDLYTRGGAEALGIPGGGTLEVGAPADVVVLSVPTWSEAIRVGGEAVAATYLAGNLTFASAVFGASQGL